MFADVDTSRWYHEGVDHVVREKLMNGVSETLFHPNHNLTRGELVTVLYRMAGTPAVEASTPFTDVAEGRFYSDAVAWAYENEITEGVTDTLFAPQHRRDPGTAGDLPVPICTAEGPEDGCSGQPGSVSGCRQHRELCRNL